MRPLLSVLFLLSAAAFLRAETAPRPATPEEVVLFKEAMKNSSQDTEHWAYTETTTVRLNKGKEEPREETVVRFDPSKPYAEQFTPLTIGGKPPSEKELKKYRKKGEERAKERARKAEKLGSTKNGEPQLVINDSKARMDLEHPLVVAETPDRITFEVPLVSKDRDIPVEKFQVLAEVDREARQVKRAHLRILQSFRMKWIAKIKSGEVTVDFTVVDPKYSPVITTMSANIGASFMLIPVQARLTNTRMEWQRVEPFDNRFNVKLGPLQFPGF